MNTLLKLEFFKSLSFPTKESGMEFIKQNPKLQRSIEEKVDEIEEAKYQILDEIKLKIFSKYETQKEVFMVQVKNKRAERLSHKKDIEKEALKEELREELLKEINQEELKKNHPKLYPDVNNELIVQLPTLENLFSQVIKKIYNTKNGSIDEDKVTAVEKQKIQVEKALEILKKAMVVMEKLNN